MEQPTTTLPAKPPTPPATPTPPTRLRRREDAPPPPQDPPQTDMTSARTETPIPGGDGIFTQESAQAVLGARGKKRGRPPGAKKAKSTTGDFGFAKRVVVEAPAYLLSRPEASYRTTIEPATGGVVVMEAYPSVESKAPATFHFTLDELRQLVAWGSAYLAALDES